MNRIGFFLTVALLLLTLALSLNLSAAPVAAATDNGCTVVGTVGNIIIARCVDEVNGGLVWGNSAGMLTGAE